MRNWIWLLALVGTPAYATDFTKFIVNPFSDPKEPYQTCKKSDPTDPTGRKCAKDGSGPLTLSELCVAAINSNKAATYEEIVKRGDLAISIRNNKDITLKSEQIDIIKQGFPALIAAGVTDNTQASVALHMLEPEEKPK
jgi:hypothetical protein